MHTTLRRKPTYTQWKHVASYDLNLGEDRIEFLAPDSKGGLSPVLVAQVVVTTWSTPGDADIAVVGRPLNKGGNVDARRLPVVIPLSYSDKVDLCRRLGIDLASPLR